MALINCPECGIEISDKALNCLKCGYPISNAVSNQFIKKTSQSSISPQVSSKSYLYILLIIVITIAAGYFMYEKSERDKVMEWRQYRDKMDPNATGEGYLDYNEWKKTR